MAALGGILVSSACYIFFNIGSYSVRGWGIPMATDIAFAIGILAFLKNRIPSTLKMLLVSIAIIDTILAILVVAIFFTNDISLFYLIMSVIVYSALLALNKFNINALWTYLVFGVILWFLILRSGVDASISGILLAIALPLGKGIKGSAGEKLERILEAPVAYIIIPLFALCNTGFEISTSLQDLASSSVVKGVLAGLLIGKPIGIFCFTYFIVKSGLTKLPTKVSFYHIFGMGFLGGIGFPTAIFISLLVFETSHILTLSKIAILIGSSLSGLIGYLILRSHIKAVSDN